MEEEEEEDEGGGWRVEGGMFFCFVLYNTTNSIPVFFWAYLATTFMRGV